VTPSALAGLEAYNEFKFGWLFDGKIARLGAVQNLVNIVTRAAKHLSVIGSIRHQPPAFDVIPGAVHRRQLRCERQGVDANLVGADEWVGRNVERVHTTLELLNGGGHILRSPHFGHDRLKSELASCRLKVDHFNHGGGIAGISQNGQSANIGQNLAQIFKPLAGKIGSQQRQARNVAPRPRQTRGQTAASPSRRQQPRRQLQRRPRTVLLPRPPTSRPPPTRL